MKFRGRSEKNLVLVLAGTRRTFFIYINGFEAFRDYFFLSWEDALSNLIIGKDIMYFLIGNAEIPHRDCGALVIEPFTDHLKTDPKIDTLEISPCFSQGVSSIVAL
jgi:hypothetical protein